MQWLSNLLRGRGTVCNAHPPPSYKKPRWLPLQVTARSWRSYENIGDCEQSIRIIMIRKRRTEEEGGTNLEIVQSNCGASRDCCIRNYHLRYRIVVSGDGIKCGLEPLQRACFLGIGRILRKVLDTWGHRRWLDVRKGGLQQTIQLSLMKIMTMIMLIA